MSCHSSDMPTEWHPGDEVPFAWTDITWLLHRHHVSWAYYLDHGAVTVNPKNQGATSIHWNPLPGFTDVHEDKQLASMRPLSVFYKLAKARTLPKVSWVMPARSTAVPAGSARRARGGSLRELSEWG